MFALSLMQLLIASSSLSKTRRKRPVPEEWATMDSISSYEAQLKSEPLFPGGKVLAVHEAGDSVLVAGSDGAGGVISLSDGRLLHPLNLSKGAATSGIWAHNRAVVATSTGSVKVFEKDQEVHSFSVHSVRVSAIALHPSGSILASVSEDQSYTLYDLESSNVLARVHTSSGMCY